jgi:two-component system NtrC family sensor kinase
VDINQVIEQTVTFLSHQAQMQKVEIIKEFCIDGSKVMADFDQLRQVFTNLLLNGIQAMSDGGILTVQTSVIKEEDLGGKIKDMVKVDVIDTGCGISKDNMRKLFTPFFTTKERGKGVGLGLAVVHGIVQRHKGRIKVDSEVGKGTTFTVYLEAHHEGNSQNTGS